MKIVVKGYFDLLEKMGGKGPVEVEKASATLREVLDDLCNRFGEEFTRVIYDPDGREVAGHLMLLVNGRNYLSMPGRLETELKDGDEIALFPPLAGG